MPCYETTDTPNLLHARKHDHIWFNTFAINADWIVAGKNKTEVAPVINEAVIRH